MGSAVELRAQVDDIDVPAEGAEASEPGLDRDARGGILSLLSVIFLGVPADGLVLALEDDPRVHTMQAGI